MRVQKNQFFFGLGLTRAGQTQPDADTLMFLCDLYGIENVLETFGYQDAPNQKPLFLSQKERKLITEYREQTDMQPAIDRLLGLEGNKADNSSETS